MIDKFKKELVYLQNNVDEKFSSDNYLKILAILGLNLIVIIQVVILLFSKPLKGYEFSIYAAFPWFFWPLIFLSFTCGLCLIFVEYFISSKKGWYIYGFLIILLIDCSILFLPLIRGYFLFGSGDVLTHIGYLNDISLTYNIGENPYPIDHILCYIACKISGLSFSQISMIIPAFFSFFFIISMYILGKLIFKKKIELVFFLVLTFILLFGVVHILLAPNHQAFLLLPLIIWLILKTELKCLQEKTFYFVLIIISLLTVLFHPLVALILIGILIIYKISPQFHSFLNGINIDKQNSKKILGLILLILILFTSWSGYLSLFSRMGKIFIETIFGIDEGKSEFERNLETFNYSETDLNAFISYIVSVYGQIILLSLFSIIFLVYLFSRKKTSQVNNNIIFSICGFVFFSLLSIIVYLKLDIFGWGRIFKTTLIFSSILLASSISIWLYNFNSKSKSLKNTIKFLFLLIFLLSLFYLSLFNLYPSPIIRSLNQQVTSSEFSGMTAFFQFRDENVIIQEFGVSQYRYYDAIYSKNAARKNIYYKSEKITPMDHFNYQRSDSLINTYSFPMYLLISDRGEFSYQNLYPEFKNKWKFTDEDYVRLNNDRGVKKIFTNNNLRVFFL